MECGTPDRTMEAVERVDTLSDSDGCLQEPCPARESAEGVGDLRKNGTL